MTPTARLRTTDRIDPPENTHAPHHHRPRRPDPGAGAALAAAWWLGDTAPYPYAQRGLLDVPLPFLTAGRMDAVLWPRPGERMLEIGPGTGLQSLHVAPQLGPEGQLDVLVLREADPEFVLLDGTLAECDRVGDSRADYSAKHRRHGVNVQVVTDPDGRLLWLSPALPGRAHDLTAARTHKIICICERQGVPIMADLAYRAPAPG